LRAHFLRGYCWDPNQILHDCSLHQSGVLKGSWGGFVENCPRGGTSKSLNPCNVLYLRGFCPDPNNILHDCSLHQSGGPTWIWGWFIKNWPRGGTSKFLNPYNVLYRGEIYKKKLFVFPFQNVPLVQAFSAKILFFAIGSPLAPLGGPTTCDPYVLYRGKIYPKKI
jgi:hypothetical protein